MKILYICEICGSKSYDKAKIEACEARGVPDVRTGPPIGFAFGEECGPGPDKCDRNCKSHLCGKGFIHVVTAVFADGHKLIADCNVFRGNGAGDGGGPYAHLNADLWATWPKAKPCAALERARVFYAGAVIT